MRCTEPNDSDLDELDADIKLLKKAKKVSALVVTLVDTLNIL